LVHADELADLLRWCAALSTDPADLAGAVLLAAGQRWSALVDSPADLRELTVKTFLETGQPPGPAVQGGMERVPEELRAVVGAFDQLPKLQRAVLMLSYLEGITNAEIAGIVDRSAARVRHDIDRGLDALGGDAYSVRAALDIASWHPPTPAEVSRAFQRHARTRARRRRRIGLAGVAVGTLAAVLLTASAVHRPYVEPRQPGASGATWVRRLPPHPTKVRIGTRSAFYAERIWPNGGGAMLWWEYADAALVIIECGDLTSPREVLPKLASRVALAVEPIMLPYRVRSVPQHYEVTSVVKGLVSRSTVTYLTRNDYPEGLLQISIRYPAVLPMFGVHYTSRVSRYTNGRHSAVCRPFGDSHICVRGELSTPGRIDIGAQRGALAVIDRIASNLEFAPSATDLTGWFDARHALPS
jgi:hypothetical protein